MRIALLASPVLPVPAPAGGAQAIVADLATGLAGRGHEVIVYCSEGSHVPGVELRTVPVPEGAELALVMPGGDPPRSVLGVHAAFDRMFTMLRRDRADAVSSHAFDAEAFEMARGLPVLHTLHLPPIVDEVTRAAGTVAPDGLATVSRSCRRDWAKAGVDIGRVLFNGVPDFGEPEGPVELIALMAGRVSPEKGVDDGIWAALRAGLKPVVVGPTYDSGYRHSLSGAEFREALSRAQLSELMARSAVVLIPIRWDEPFGLVAAEAQMAGCPVAAYRRGAMQEVVEEGESGYLATPDSVEALAEAARRALTLDRRAVRMSAQRRLGLGPMLDGYESALKAIAG
jgi:glycosyltransferase involved in cell wall biosynthesis